MTVKVKCVKCNEKKYIWVPNMRTAKKVIRMIKHEDYKAICNPCKFNMIFKHMTVIQTEELDNE